MLSELLIRDKGRIKLSTADHSLIYKPGYDDQPERSWLFDVRTDPGEQADLSARNPGLTRELTGKLLEMEFENSRIKVPPAEFRSVPPEQIKQLKALGYLR